MSFMAAWPTGRTDDLDRAFACWAKLTDDDRKAAREKIDAFRIENRKAGRSTICAAATYLKQRSWDRVGGGNANAPKGGGHTVGAFSRSWWCVLHRRLGRGESVRLMLSQATSGIGYAVPAADLPSEGDELVLAKIGVGSAAFSAWRDALAEEGLTLPEVTVPFVWMPEAWPGGSEPLDEAAERWRDAI